VTGTCENVDCPVATTGKCLLSHPNLSDCPQFRSGAASDVVSEPPLKLAGEAPKPTTVEKQGGRRFHLGNELGTEDAVEIMRARYGQVIGVLGSTDAGKTCFLSSLYLMASGGTLPVPFEFAGSLTLQAFEDRARGLRKWKDGILPSQLADHTFLPDPRQPSLLHLAIRESTGDRRRFDLLLTDLPGEWTDKLVLHASYADSFKFLRRADGIILVVDGPLLSSNGRHVEMQRLRNFTERLANEVKVSVDTSFVILVSKCDEIDMRMPPAANDLAAYVESLGYPASTIAAASFSRKPDQVNSGTGVLSAIEAIISRPNVAEFTSHPRTAQEPDARTFHNFRE
jgi:hypothetical protein